MIKQCRALDAGELKCHLDAHCQFAIDVVKVKSVLIVNSALSSFKEIKSNHIIFLIRFLSAVYSSSIKVTCRSLRSRGVLKRMLMSPRLFI